MKGSVGFSISVVTYLMVAVALSRGRHCLGESPPRVGVLPLFDLDDLEDDGVLGENAKHVEDAHDHPGLNRGQALGLGGVGRHGVEDVHQHEKQCHQQRHPA